MKKIIYFFIILVLNVLFIFISVHFYTIYKLDYKSIYVASHNIDARKLISSEDIKEIRVPSVFIGSNIETDIDNIINKYTDINITIPKDSFFYKSILFDGEELNDISILKLYENEVLFTMETSVMNTSSNSLISGLRVDLYGYIELNKIIYEDLLLKNVRIVSVNDCKGLDINHPDSNNIPCSLSLALNKDNLKYVSLLNKIGSIELYPNYESYNTLNSEELYRNSRLISILNNYINESKNE